MFFKIKDSVDVFGATYYEVVDTDATLTEEGGYQIASFDNLQDAEACLAKVNYMTKVISYDAVEMEELILLSTGIESDIDTLTNIIDQRSPSLVEVKGMLRSIKDLHSLRCARIFDSLNGVIKLGTIKSSIEVKT